MTEELKLVEILNMDFINNNRWFADAILEEELPPTHSQERRGISRIRIYKTTLTKPTEEDKFYVVLFDKKDSAEPIKRIYTHKPTHAELR